MSKNCLKHQCLKNINCGHKVWLGYLALCGIDNHDCENRALYPYGRYEPEDVLLP